MTPQSLSQVLRNAGLSSSLAVDPMVIDITEDSRDVKPNWIFAAVPGTSEDGARYIHDAVLRGATAIIAEAPADASIPVIVVPNVRQALADTAASIHGSPSKKLSVAGVTGTDGKTTTCFLLASILAHCGVAAGMITTVEIRVGGETLPSRGRLTTPGAPFVQRTLARMVEDRDTVGIIECSSHALAQERLRGTYLATAAITNVASDHIDFHGSHEAYGEAKARILDLLVPDGSIMVNADDPVSTALMSGRKRRITWFGSTSDAALRASQIQTRPERTTFMAQHDDISLPVTIPLGGRFNVYNSLAAVGMAMALGIEFQEAIGGLKKAEPPPGRLQCVDAGQPFTVYVDYAHTEQAFASTMQFLSDAARDQGGRLIAVFGAAGNRDKSKRPRLAQMASDLCSYFFITNEDPFGEDASDIIKQVASGAPESTRDMQWTTILDRREAIESAFRRARPGDVVAITGKGHEHSIAVGAMSLEWNDVQVTRELLTELGYDGDRRDDKQSR